MIPTNFEDSLGYNSLFEAYEPVGTANDRGKGFGAMSAIPFFVYDAGPRSIYFSQLEASVGLGPTLTFGINLGELADFFLGWAGKDILQDDLSSIKPDRDPWRTFTPDRSKEDNGGDAFFE